jgi:hypothetical protein
VTTQKLYIPDRVKVGQVERADTYTGRLGYVIYYDHKGVLRKEVSWESWRDKKIDPLDSGNEPTSGFVLNRSGGGNRGEYSWDHRAAFIRVFDPRGFEFEISVSNLLFILRENDCSKGKGLEGEFVYAWHGTDLVLLPVGSIDYQVSKGFTNLQATNVKVRDLVIGSYYAKKNAEGSLVYLGKFLRHNECKYTRKQDGYRMQEPAKVFVFHDGKSLVLLTNLTSLSCVTSDTPPEDFADLVDQYNKSVHGTKAVALFTKPKNMDKYRDFWAIPHEDGYYIYHSYAFSCVNSLPTTQTLGYYVYTDDTGLQFRDINQRIYHRERSEARHHWGTTPINYEGWTEDSNQELWVRLESGSEFLAMSILH